MKRRGLVGTAVVGGLILVSSVTACASSRSSGVPPSGVKNLGTFTMTTEPWLGYGPWYIAQSKGFFTQQGLHVKILNFTEDAPDVAAVASGQADAANAATNGWLADMSKFSVTGVLLLDQSNTADAVLAGKGIASVSDLRGKSVAFEQGTTSDILIHHALAQANIPFSAIKAVHLPAAQAGSALIAGKVDAAVTYEPYVSAALGAGSGYHTIYTAGQDPGLISDVFYVRSEVLKQHANQIPALLRAWDLAVQYLHDHPADGQAIIAKEIGAPAGSLTSAFKGVQIYSLQQSQTLVSTSFPKTYTDIATAGKAAGLLQSAPPPFSSVFDDNYLKAAVGAH